MTTPSITNMSSFMDQYGLMPWCNCSLACGQPVIIKCCSLCKCSSCLVACWIYCMDMHSDISVATCTTSTLMSNPLITLFLFSWWLCWDSQCAIQISGPGLYIVLILYWWILRMMHLILWDSVATSFLNMATRGLWSVYYSYISGKAIIMKLFKTMKYSQCLPFYVAVPALCTGEAFAGKCNG